ncbi:MAG: hypothetical protein ACRCYU_15115 [Nocardioides sp.]
MATTTPVPAGSDTLSVDAPRQFPAVVPPVVAVGVRAVAAVEAARVLLLAAGDTADARCDRRAAGRLYAAAGELAWLQAVGSRGSDR